MMNSKKVKRVILISLVLLMAMVYTGYKFGAFNALLKKPDIDALASASTTQDDEGKQQDSNAEDNEVEIIERKEPDAGQSLVSIVQSAKEKASDINYEEIRDMVKEAIDLAGGFDGLIKDGQTVVLKPNLVQMHVDSTGQPFDKELNGATTDWRVTKAVVEMVRKYNPNGKVYIMEGSAGDGTRKTMEHLYYNPQYIPGVDEFIAIEEDSGKWQDFASPGLVKHSLPNGLLNKEYYLNKKYFECDVLISLPCLKTNSGTVVSGSIKNVSIGATPANIYGVSAKEPGRTRMVSHKIIDGELDKWIYDYYMCKPVDFVVMDGLQGFQNGPVPIGRENVTGDRMNMRLIMAGRDAVATDTVEALVIGWDPESVQHLTYLSASGMGNMDTSKIRVAGKFVDEVGKDFKIRFTNLGGVHIDDRTPPKLSITNQEIVDGKLMIHVNVSEDTTKMEVLVDDKLQRIYFPPDLKRVILEMPDFSGQNHSVAIYTYDKFLNHAVVRTDFFNTGKETDGNTYFFKKSSLLNSGDIEGLIKQAL